MSNRTNSDAATARYVRNLLEHIACRIEAELDTNRNYRLAATKAAEIVREAKPD